MRVSMDWIRDWIDLPTGITAREVATRLIDAGLEVESVDTLGEGFSGTALVGRVDQIEELTGFKKPIRWCQVDVGSAAGGVRGIICGASNFAEGDHVVVALPGTTLPGDFVISARETYGHTSDGMICSERELGLGDDHAGIIVLDPADETTVGQDAAEVLGLGTEILDIAVTPDRGYALSIRGIAREVATAFGLEFTDRSLDLVELPAPSDAAAPWDCSVADASVADLFTLRRIVGFDPKAPTPAWMRRRLIAAGMRPVSLAVDVTNYVMLEHGQPLHAFDGSTLSGTVRADRAGSDRSLVTLDHVERTLDPDDIVIRDDSGPIGLAGTMGGLATEITDDSTDIVLEAAHFDPVAVARTVRRHRLPSEASRRFERGVDRVIAPYASAHAAQLLIQFGGGAYVGMTAWESPFEPTVVTMPVDLASRTAGMPIDIDTVVTRLQAVGCEVEIDTGSLTVTIPTWRPDLTDPADLVEEVIRLGGYDAVPSILPAAPSGFGLTREQRLRRRVALALAGTGVVEVLSYPFIGSEDLDALLISDDDVRRAAPLLANPLRDEQPMLRTTLLPGLLAAVRRSLSRGSDDIALSEMGRVFRLREGQSPSGVTDAPRPGVHERPSSAQLAALEALLPDQPRHLATVFTGHRERAGWWGPGVEFDWADAIQAARDAAAAVGLELEVAQGSDAPFHPGRCAQLSVSGHVIGYAGELHPRVIAAASIPPRTAAFELDLDALIHHAIDAVPAPQVGTQPVAKEDLALVVAADVPAADVAATVREGGGDLLESVRLFDVYTGPQVPDGSKSLAFSLRLRAPDRTLSADDIAAVRDGALALATQRHGATLRGS
jgi:phenylalanyl-tRNA synthetase beta chain